jgi:hypothetical protein
LPASFWVSQQNHPSSAHTPHSHLTDLTGTWYRLHWRRKWSSANPGLVWLDCIHEWIWISHSGYPIALVRLLWPCRRNRKTKVCLPFDDCNRN